jgi:hypothetical protein
MFAGRSLRYIASTHGIGKQLLKVVREGMGALRGEVKKDQALEGRERFLELIDKELMQLAEGKTMKSVPQKR